jgi:rubredoxin
MMADGRRARLARSMKKYQCTVCGHIYDPADGDPSSDIRAGTPFDKLPDTWSCPDCGAVKADFEPIED